MPFLLLRLLRSRPGLSEGSRQCAWLVCVHHQSFALATQPSPSVVFAVCVDYRWIELQVVQLAAVGEIAIATAAAACLQLSELKPLSARPR